MLPSCIGYNIREKEKYCNAAIFSISTENTTMKNITAANALTIIANITYCKAIDTAKKAIAVNANIGQVKNLMQMLSTKRFYIIGETCNLAGIDDPASYNHIESELHSIACKELKTGIAIVNCNDAGNDDIMSVLQSSLHSAINSFADCGVAFEIVTEIVHPTCMICYIDPARIEDLLQCLADQWEDAPSCIIQAINLPA